MEDKIVDDSAEKMPPPPSRHEQATIERAEEQKLRAKYPQVCFESLANCHTSYTMQNTFFASNCSMSKYLYFQANKNLPMSGGGGGGGGGGHSAFLQKRLAKGQKYFDSGDYQMAKQKGPRGAAGRLTIPVLAQPPTGDTIPTPDTVPARKSSIIQPMHDHTRSLHVPSDPAHLGQTPTPPAPGQPMPNPAITKLAS